jgi:hypothetical protein
VIGLRFSRIVTQRNRLGVEQALDSFRRSARIPQARAGEEWAFQIELLYKPFLTYPLVLTKRYIFRPSKAIKVLVVVDGLSGIARYTSAGSKEYETLWVDEGRIMPVKLAPEEVMLKVKSTLFALRTREKASGASIPECQVVYKPIYRVEGTDVTGVVDAVTGYVAVD